MALLEGAGVTEREARSLLGKMVKDHGKPAVITAVAETLAANPASPKEYLAAVLAGKSNGARSQAELNRGGAGNGVVL